MRIATITCHDVYNYGASLQAYALQEYCRSLGHEYTIIDYKPPYLSGHYNFWLVANPVYKKPILKQLYLMAKLPGRMISLKRKHNFDNFTREYLRLTSKRYASNQQLADDTPQADIYIAGSDQIWNTFFKNGSDPAFYLDFAKGKGKRISYAASFATEVIHNGLEQFVADQITNLDAVSIRESSGIDLANQLGRKDATLVCDPVFLLPKEKWATLIKDKKRINEKYILVYDCERSNSLKNTALKLKHQTKLPIYSLSPLRSRYADRDFSLSGPLDFLHLIANAEYVVANSFHALAFSLIFEKQFYIVNRSEAINTRMHDFLTFLGLEDRLISSPNQLELKDYNHQSISDVLSNLIGLSKHFIKI